MALCCPPSFESRANDELCKNVQANDGFYSVPTMIEKMTDFGFLI